MVQPIKGHNLRQTRSGGVGLQTENENWNYEELRLERIEVVKPEDLKM